jgi:hypothetical protein
MPTIHSTAATNKDAVVFNQPPCHSKGLIVCHSDSVVEGIFKASVAMAQFLEKLVFGRHVVEIEGIARREDDDLL